jgi:hypothetical protein
MESLSRVHCESDLLQAARFLNLLKPSGNFTYHEV